MASYRLDLRPSLQKDFRSLPRELVPRVWEKIEALTNDPLPRGAAKMEGSEGLYRIRIGDYRVIYSVDFGAHVILVQYVRHRREVYRRF